MDLIEQQLAQLGERIGDFDRQDVPGTGILIRIRLVPLASGWSKPQTTVIFLVPQGYPFAKPDCFWVDFDLRVNGGCLPQNTQLNNKVPGLAEDVLWFSWHVDPWNPSRDNLITWWSVILRRLEQPK